MQIWDWVNNCEISFIHLDTINNGNNNNTYIGNFRVQHNDNSTSPNQQMMSQMTDGFKPFYKKYGNILDISQQPIVRDN